MSTFDFLLQRPRRRRRLPLAGAFFAPSGLSCSDLATMVSSLARSTSDCAAQPPFQRSNASSLLRKVAGLASLAEAVAEAMDCYFPAPMSPPPRRRGSEQAKLFLRELYVVLFRAKLLIEYVAGSGRAWLLLRAVDLAAAFRDLDVEIAVLLDVLRPAAAALSASLDARQLLDLLRSQCRRRQPDVYLEPAENALRAELLSFVDDFQHGETPSPGKLHPFLVDRLGIADDAACQAEVELLEELTSNYEEIDADLPLIGAVSALLRYCRFAFFIPNENSTLSSSSSLPLLKRGASKKISDRLLSSGSDEPSFALPKEFMCPISLELMRDPVVVSTGQTYDRASIVQWFEEGHSTCPNSGLTLGESTLMPNRALRGLIAQCCSFFAIPYELLDSQEALAESAAVASSSQAAVAANRATSWLLVKLLSDQSEDVMAVAAHEVRMLAKTGGRNRTYLAELGAIPLLCRVLVSNHDALQENAVTALLNLSIHEANKARIMEIDGCLSWIVHVLQCGLTVEARENAAATLFSLSVVHDYKKRIADEPYALEELGGMLITGTTRGKKDVVMALFNISTHPESSRRLLDSGAVAALVDALAIELITEEAAGALGLLMKDPSVALIVGSSETIIPSLMGLLRKGNPKGKENAVAALYELCRRGGAAALHRVAKTPGLNILVQNVILSGTKRARKKASLVVRMCQRAEMPAAHSNRSSVDSTASSAAGTTIRRNSNMGGDDLLPTPQMNISVPVP